MRLGDQGTKDELTSRASRTTSKGGRKSAHSCKSTSAQGKSLACRVLFRMRYGPIEILRIDSVSWSGQAPFCSSRQSFAPRKLLQLAVYSLSYSSMAGQPPAGSIETDRHESRDLSTLTEAHLGYITGTVAFAARITTRSTAHSYTSDPVVLRSPSNRLRFGDSGAI